MIEPWRLFMFFVSAAAFAWIARGDIAAGFSGVMAWWGSRKANVVTTPQAAAGVTAEQAQAAELILSRFISENKANKDDAVYKLVANGITTLAEQVK